MNFVYPSKLGRNGTAKAPSAMKSPEFQIRLPPRLWAAVGLLALAFGTAACSSVEGDETSRSAEPSPAAAPRPTEPSALSAVELPPPPFERPSGGDSIPMRTTPPADAEPWGGGDDYDLESEEELALALKALKDPDPVERSDAVLDIDPEGRGLPYLLEVLSDDADPEVRIAAVSQLANTESPEAIAGLVSALNDRDPEVVLEAIDALEFSADHTMIGSLEKLFQHPDPDVREAARDAVEHLED